MRTTETHATASYAKRAAAMIMPVVTFRLEKECYGVPIGQVQEVILCRDIAKSFEMPEHIVGIYNLRGTIIPIVDLKQRLGIPSQPSGEQQILICKVHGCVVGFIVDEVIQVMKIPKVQIKPAPASLSAKAPNHIIGIAALEGGLTTIIDIAAGVAPVSADPTIQEG
jgi:purine-binding chemotaxis protein CheW